MLEVPGISIHLSVEVLNITSMTRSLNASRQLWSPGWTRGDIVWCCWATQALCRRWAWRAVSTEHCWGGGVASAGHWLGEGGAAALPLPASSLLSALSSLPHRDEALHQSQRVIAVFPIYG